MKKRIVIVSIIAAVLIAAGVILFLLLSPKTVEGAWELTVNPEIAQATPDEATSQKACYVFEKSGQYGDGTYKTYYDGGVEKGDYKLSEKDGKKLINLGTGDLPYVIDGGKLTITYPAQTDEATGQTTPAQDYIFTRTDAPDYENEHFSTFETDKKLLKSWTTSARTLAYFANELSYTETVKFSDNGVMTIHYESADLALNREMYYAYTAENGKLTFSLVTDKENKNTVAYEFDKDGNLQFKDDNTTSSIFADAVFSDVIYQAE